MKFSFEVGTHEKHQVEFSWSQMTGALNIKVDGSLILHRAIQFLSPTNLGGKLDVPSTQKWELGGLEIQLVDKWAFEVGTVERREVRIEKERPKWAAAFRPHDYRVFVDDQLTKEYRGY